MTNVSSAEDGRPRMLVADDDPSIVRVLVDRCTSMGFNVDTASNGIQVLMKARRNAPEVIIIDVNMPGADGLSVCSRLLGPGGKPVDVVVVTGSGDPETINRCESLGAFYARKGADFWENIHAALLEIFPRLADGILESSKQSANPAVHVHSRVLFIDNDPDTREFLLSRLKKFGVEMLSASDGVQGYRIARREQPSVIISDYSIANGGITYLLWKLRSTWETENIPVFATSALPLTEAVEQSLQREVCGRQGVAKFFHKPLNTGQLFGALQQFCGFEMHFDEWEAAARLSSVSMQPVPAIGGSAVRREALEGAAALAGFGFG